MTADLAISVRGLTKDFGSHRVVDHFDMDVPKGAIYGFLGPNGSGKTTTIRMMCGLLTPESGTGQCLGFDIIREAQQIKEHVGYMTQKFSLYEDLTIRENLDFIARMYRMKDRSAKVSAALADLGLTNRAGQLAGTLSGGWKQRLALAAAMLHGPQLLRSGRARPPGVDPKARREFLGRDPPPFGAGRHGAGIDPLYGRGGAMRFHRLYRLWQKADLGAGRRHPGTGRADHMARRGA